MVLVDCFLIGKLFCVKVFILVFKEFFSWVVNVIRVKLFMFFVVLYFSCVLVRDIVWCSFWNVFGFLDIIFVFIWFFSFWMVNWILYIFGKLWLRVVFFVLDKYILVVFFVCCLMDKRVKFVFWGVNWFFRYFLNLVKLFFCCGDNVCS